MDIGAYEVGKLIAESCAAQVYQGRHRQSGECVAIKVNKTSTHREVIQQLARLSYPCLLLPREVFEHNGHIVEVMPYLDWPDLRFSAARESAAKAKHVVTQVVDGLAYLHAHGIVHHDVRDVNIFVHPDSLEAKLFDFSSATKPYFLEKGLKSWNPVPPEFEQGNCMIDFQFDVYQVGDVLVHLTHRFDWKSQQLVPQPDVPRALLGVMERAKDMDRSKRYRNCQELLDDLRKGG
jgi:serine/threonine protein kinase